MPQEMAVRHRRASIAVAPSLEKVTGAAGDFARASKATSTRRAYQADAVGQYGLQPLPASIDTVAAYLAALAAAGLKASTINRRCAGIGYMHRIAGVQSPTGCEAIKAVLAGIRRTIGSAATRKAPATAGTLGAIVAAIPSDLRGLRDRALLLVGFAGALRRSELVALDVADLEESTEGFIIRIRRSKTDQEGTGDFVSVPYGSRLRPVRALKDWLRAAGITEGPVFRPIRRGGSVVEPDRLTDRSVGNIVKAHAEAVGLDPDVFSGHSLRAGFVTSALQAGADVLRVMDVTRHRQVNTLRVYDRRAKAFKQHAGEAFL